LYSSPNIVEMIKSMVYMKHVTQMRKNREVYKVFVIKLKEIYQFETLAVGGGKY
jgi:hypothetical protein